MKSSLFSLLTIILLASCGSDTDMPIETGDNGQISSADYAALIAPCTDESKTITLPDPMTIMSNYAQFESTTEIFHAFELSKNLLISLGVALLPPPSSIYADVDDITVYEGDNAYDWKVGADTYRYILNDNGYELRFFKNSDLISTGVQMVVVEQNDNCTDFQYIQYAIEADGEQNVGDPVFKYHYQKAGTATLISFGTDITNIDGEEYRMRSFEDLSGDMTLLVNGTATKNYNWQSNGNGSFDILEDGLIVDSGTWSF